TICLSTCRANARSALAIDCSGIAMSTCWAALACWAATLAGSITAPIAARLVNPIRPARRTWLIDAADVFSWRLVRISPLLPRGPVFCDRGPTMKSAQGEQTGYSYADYIFRHSSQASYAAPGCGFPA